MRLVLTAEHFNSDSLRRSESVDRSKFSPDTREVEYVALSYAWGTVERPAITTVHNISQRLLDIKIRQLRRTVRNAAKSVNKMGIKYLWIDALCIIQPSKFDRTDWEHESRLMGHVRTIVQLRVGTPQEVPYLTGARSIPMLTSR